MIMGVIWLSGCYPYPHNTTYTMAEYEKYALYCASKGMKLMGAYSTSKASCTDGTVSVAIPESELIKGE